MQGRFLILRKTPFIRVVDKINLSWLKDLMNSGTRIRNFFMFNQPFFFSEFTVKSAGKQNLKIFRINGIDLSVLDPIPDKSKSRRITVGCRMGGRSGHRN